MRVHLHGLGPLNWIAKRALRSFLRRHLKEYLEKEGRDMIEQELQNAAAAAAEESSAAAMFLPSYVAGLLS